jgi:predicted small lipoprotein YifL
LSRPYDRRFLRLAVVGALAAALGLGACGRKGSLDPPPSSSLTGEQQQPQQPQQQQASPAGNPVITPFGSPKPAGSNDQVVNGPKKHIFLDDLLD